VKGLVKKVTWLRSLLDQAISDLEKAVDDGWRDVVLNALKMELENEATHDGTDDASNDVPEPERRPAGAEHRSEITTVPAPPQDEAAPAEGMPDDNISTDIRVPEVELELPETDSAPPESAETPEGAEEPVTARENENDPWANALAEGFVMLFAGHISVLDGLGQDNIRRALGLPSTARNREFWKALEAKGYTREIGRERMWRNLSELERFVKQTPPDPQPLKRKRGRPWKAKWSTVTGDWRAADLQ